MSSQGQGHKDCCAVKFTSWTSNRDRMLQALHTRSCFVRQLTLQFRRHNVVRENHFAAGAAFTKLELFITDKPAGMSQLERRETCSFLVDNKSFSTSSHTARSATPAYTLESSNVPLESFHARDLYKVAVNAVEPRPMVEHVLQFDPESKTLSVNDEVYKIDRNVYVVGFGKAVLGMARAVEDVLGEHVVSGILSIPRGQRLVLSKKGKEDLLLLPSSTIQVFEGGDAGIPDAVAHQAALSIEELLSERSAKDLVIVLVSGGGSPLLPCPEEPISLEDLVTLTRVLSKSGASVKDLNIIRKNLERLKGGKMVDVAHPAKVVSLIISDMPGDPVPMIASGPTVHDPVTAHQCNEILTRLKARHKMPSSILTHLEQQMADEAFKARLAKASGSSSDNSLGGVDRSRGYGVGYGVGEAKGREKPLAQNVLVGSNGRACQAAVEKARELGHLPYVLSARLEGEARTVGAMLAKLGVFMCLCFDRKLSARLSHGSHAMASLPLELEVVKAGVSKRQVNEIVKLVDMAANMGRNAVIISGGSTTVNVVGQGGTGGRNLELALGAAIQLQEMLQLTGPRAVPDVTLLSADTDGEDGPHCPAAGAVVNENFVLEARAEGFSCGDYLRDNDTYGLFRRVRGGSNLVVMNMTGTNVMDLQVLIVRNPLV